MQQKKATEKTNKIQVLPAGKQKYNIFKKSEEEKKMLAEFKAAHNKAINSLFGTKRPTAGVVKRYLSSL